MQPTGIYLFPLAEPRRLPPPWPEGGLIARRIPDLLCTYLGSSDAARTALVEIRAADEQGRPTGEWARLREEPDPADARAFLAGEEADWFVSGTLTGTPDRLRLVLNVAPAGEIGEARTLAGEISAKTPIRDFLALARALARALKLDVLHEAFAQILGRSPEVFVPLLAGLEGAAGLDPELLRGGDPLQRLAPLVDALAADPGCGLALRRLNQALHEGLAARLFGLEQAVALLDRALELQPKDGDAMTSIGEFLAAIDEEERAERWLSAAAALEDAPAPCLESLGILLANRGQTVQARNLWLIAVDRDGHPDFFAHLARLAFLEGDLEEAWDKAIRGLRRLNERRLHPGEWGREEQQRAGVLLHYLAEHLEDLEDTRHEPPADLVELLVDLVAQIRDPDDRVDLGLCLAHVGRREEAVRCLQSALPHAEDPERTAAGWDLLGALTLPEFELRMRTEVGTAVPGETGREALAWFERAAAALPRHGGVWLRLGREHLVRANYRRAREAFEQAAFLRRGDAAPLRGVAAASLALGLGRDAEDALRRALVYEPDSAGLHADLAMVLHRLGRDEEAIEALETAEDLDPEHPSVAQARERLG